MEYGLWGNPRLITWDFGKEITLSLTDALISIESLRLLMGGSIKEAAASNTVTIYRNAEGTVTTADTLPKFYDSVSGNTYVIGSAGTGEKAITVSASAPARILNLSTGKRYDITSADDEDITTTGNFAVGNRLRVFWTETRDGSAAGSNAVEITISPNTFPGALDYDRAS